jgi:CRP/FNR family transcriptional regulator
MTLAAVVDLLGLTLPEELARVDATFPVRRVRAGEALHRTGDAFRSIAVVRSGFFKTVLFDQLGEETVLGFPTGGDVIGIDAIDSGHHLVETVALDMSSVVTIPFGQLTRLGQEHPGIERIMYGLFSRELAHTHAMYCLLGTMGAEARLASFLIETSGRFGRLGCSRNDFTLRATRQEIGSYLGLKLETVSRTLSSFAAAGLIAVDRREVTLLDPAGLRRVAAGGVANAPKSTALRRNARGLFDQSASAPADEAVAIAA